MANALKELSEQELRFREMTLEGILAIQAGDNPRVVQEKLIAYVAPAERPTRRRRPRPPPPSRRPRLRAA